MTRDRQFVSSVQNARAARSKDGANVHDFAVQPEQSDSAAQKAPQSDRGNVELGHRFGQYSVEPRPVQLEAEVVRKLASKMVSAAAAYGTRGAASRLPQQAAIQKSFGRHDIRGIAAHLGTAATRSTKVLGARAYASGEHVVFGASPSLRTSAHEAAHIVQQRGGVQLTGGLGRRGDTYERHADAVAERVMQGRSSESLLDRFAGSRAATSGRAVRGATPPVGAAVQGLEGKELEEFEAYAAELVLADYGQSGKNRETLQELAQALGKGAKTFAEAVAAFLTDSRISEDVLKTVKRQPTLESKPTPKEIAKENKVEKSENKDPDFGKPIAHKGQWLQVKKTFGKGSFGVVRYLQAHAGSAPSKTRRSSYAMKESSPEEIKKEAAIYERLGSNRNIPEQGGTSKSPDDKNMHRLFMEAMHQGSLWNVAAKIKTAYIDKKTLSAEKYWGILQYIAAEVLEGIAHMHSKGLIHHDIKPENIFLNNAQDVKLGDMGGAVEVGQTNAVRTPIYASKNSTDLGPAEEGDDMYSLGSALFWLHSSIGSGISVARDGATDLKNAYYLNLDLHKKPSYTDDKDAEKFQHTKGLPPAFVSFVNAMMSPDAKQRPTANQALNHAWIKPRLLSDSEARALLKSLG